MSLIEKLKADLLHTRKIVNEEVHYKVVVSLLTTLIGEAMMIGKNDGNRETTNDEVIAVMKKFVKGMDETLAVRPGDEATIFEKKVMVDYIEKYGPEQFSGARIENMITGIIIVEKLTSVRDMGKIMKVLKSKYAGQYNGKFASQSAREQLLEIEKNS